MSVCLFVSQSVRPQSISQTFGYKSWVDLDLLNKRTKGVKKWLFLVVKTKKFPFGRQSCCEFSSKIGLPTDGALDS